MFNFLSPKTDAVSSTTAPPLSEEERTQLLSSLKRELERPPTIGLVGVSGVGKSSTVNAMFKAGLAVSHTTACTKEFTPVTLTLKQGEARGLQTRLVVKDAPGLGEDVSRDREYLDMYRRELPHCDIILWVMSARNRAVALDQQYLRYFADLGERIVFGINQVDLVHPMNWKPGMPIPSREQTEHIASIVEDRRMRLSDVLGRQAVVIPYSNHRGYNLESLFTALVSQCRGDRAWIFGALKGFRLDDFVDVEHFRSLG